MKTSELAQLTYESCMNGRPAKNGMPGIKDKASETRQPMRCPLALDQNVIAYPTLSVKSGTVKLDDMVEIIPKSAGKTGYEADVIHDHKSPAMFGRRNFTVEKDNQHSDTSLGATR